MLDTHAIRPDADRHRPRAGGGFIIDLLRPFLPRRRRAAAYCDPPPSAASRASMARAPESELAIE